MKKIIDNIGWLGACIKKIALPTLALCLTIQASAQVTVTGSIKDDAGAVLPGVSVSIKNSTVGTMSGNDGAYSLSVPNANATLVFSYLGYATQEIGLAGRTTLDVVMSAQSQSLNDVVVIGYGTAKKSTLTSAVSKMDARGIEDRPLGRAESALQGQLAGVQVRTVSGEPGGDLQIRVRGAASLNASSDPLYVIDGVPSDNLSGINPEDIQAVEVLKDAASAAIYGSRGSNGVVLVSTKRGGTGKARVSASVAYGVQTPEKLIDMLTPEEWMEVRVKWTDAKYLAAYPAGNIADDNATRFANVPTGNKTQIGFDNRWFNYVSEAARNAHPAAAAEGKSEGELSLLNWQEEYFNPASIVTANVNVAGGTQNTSYMFSGGYYTQDGIAPNSGYDRYSLRTNVESKLTKWLAAGMQLAPTYSIRHGAGIANGKDSPSQYLLESTPVSEPGVGYHTNTYGNPMYAWGKSVASPIDLTSNINDLYRVNVQANAFVRATPLDGLKIEVTGAAGYYDSDEARYTFTENSTAWGGGPGKSSRLVHSTARSWRTLLQGVVNYDKSFGLHNVGIMAGTSNEQQGIGFSTSQDWRNNFPNDEMIYSWSSKDNVNGTSVTQNTPRNLASVFGRLQYNYDERYMVSASLRYDGSSVFGAKNKWGLFPAVTAGWNIAREKFWDGLGLSWWNTLKLRASYGATGNNNISTGAAYATLSSAMYGGANGYYVASGALGNDELGWEKTHSTDIAIDFGFLNNRFQLSLDWYTKTTTDLLYSVPTLSASGSSVAWMNAGEIYNQGFEVELNTDNIRSGDLKWSTSFNFAYNTNEVKQLGEENTTIYTYGWSGMGSSSVLQVGHPMNEFYMLENIGVWKSWEEIDAYAASIGKTRADLKQSSTNIVPGDPRYNDKNRDGIINDATGETDDRVYLGSPTPKCIFGMTNRLSWKGFDVSLLFTAQTGGMIYQNIGRAIDRSAAVGTTNVTGNWANAWWSETETGDGKTPNPLTNKNPNVDSRWLYSSDYFRIKNLTIGYTIPGISKWVSRARIYVSMENLLIFDKYAGYSPEAANGNSGGSWGGTSALGVDYSSYPTARTFMFGLNLNF